MDPSMELLVASRMSRDLLNITAANASIRQALPTGTLLTTSDADGFTAAQNRLMQGFGGFARVHLQTTAASTGAYAEDAPSDGHKKAFTEISSLEYAVLKIPYELLSRRFRTMIKQIGKQTHALEVACDAILREIPQTNDAIPAHKIASKYAFLIEKLNSFTENFNTGIDAEMECAEALVQRADYLTKGESGSQEDRDFFQRQRIYRFIIDHLLRLGYFETAQQLADRIGTEHLTNTEVFQVAKQVEESLRSKDLSLALQWIADNRSKLHRLNSDIEIEVKVQYAVELVRVGKRLEALNYCKKNFVNLQKNKWAGPILPLMTIIGAGHDFPGEPYQRLTSEDRWNHLIDLFRQENARIFNISQQSPFSVCLQLGISAHKTPYCKENDESRCIVCRELFNFSLGLPYAHFLNSHIICPHKSEIINESNVPMMLPNGQIYGESAIHELTRGDEVYDPKSGSYYNLRDLKRVFIL